VVDGTVKLSADFNAKELEEAIIKRIQMSDKGFIE